MPRLNGNETLTPSQYKEFVEATEDAFDTKADLDRAVMFTVGKPLRKVVNADDDVETVIQELLREADRQFWSAQLLATFRSQQPESPRFVAFAQQFGISPEAATSSLEALVQPGDQLLDVAPWLAKLGTLESQVCRIELDDYLGIGTGFLLGPNAVMTNYHVVQNVINGSVTPSRIGMRFDFKAKPDKVQVNPGQVYRLAAEWDIAHSPYSDFDTQLEPAGVPGTEHLDYALLRTDGAPGNDPASGAMGVAEKGPARGVIPVPIDPHDWTKPTGVVILQHAEGMPLKFAIPPNTKTEVLPPKGTPTRVRYSTRTEKGSSGSPCFDVNLNLIALHHGGDPKYDLLKVKADWNEGIPLTTILSSLPDGARAAIGPNGS